MTLQKTNPVIYFEIPVLDMDRAMRFYEELFGFSFEREELDGYDMAFFPLHQNQPGITGALAKGDVYQPSHQGAILYFHTHNLDEVLAKASQWNASILYPKTTNNQFGFVVAEIEDSEGNRLALKQIL